MRRRSRAAAASPAKHRSADAAAAPAPKQTSLKRKASGAAPEAAALPAVKAQAVVVSRKASCAVPCLGAARTMEDPLSAEPLESDDAWDDDDADSYGAATPSSPVSDGADSGDEGHHRSGGAATAATGATCLDAQGRADAQEAAVRDVSGLLGVTPGSASLLLRRFKWNKEDMLSRYMEDPQQVCLDSGLPAPDSGASAPTMSARAAPGSVCLICQEVLEAGKAAVSSLACGHAFCNGCWATYLELKIAEGDIAISCPQYKCRLRVPEEVVASLCPGEVALRFKAFLRNSFVDDSRTATWCPHAGCTLAVDTAAAGEGGFVTCGSGHAFCTRCKHPDAHAPAPCALVKQWQIKCDDDSETMNWLHTHTQDCPQCKMTIEKNGGCNHMTCRSCQHQFCWVCAGPWTAHGDSYYSCSKFNADTKATKESSQASSRAALERYLHHFHRFMNHDASRKLEAATRARAEATITALQVANPEAAQWGDVSFVQAGVEAAMQCRQVLKWTYVLAYFMADKSPPKELFCFAQAELEARTERLSELLEKPAETLLQPAVRKEILALVGAATASREKLLLSAPHVEAPGPSGAAAATAT